MSQIREFFGGGLEAGGGFDARNTNVGVEERCVN